VIGTQDDLLDVLDDGYKQEEIKNQALKHFEEPDPISPLEVSHTSNPPLEKNPKTIPEEPKPTLSAKKTDGPNLSAKKTEGKKKNV